MSKIIKEFITNNECRDCKTIQIFQCEKIKGGWKGNFYCETCQVSGNKQYIYTDKRIEELKWKYMEDL